jgi:hypothetical protein
MLGVGVGWDHKDDLALPQACDLLLPCTLSMAHRHVHVPLFVVEERGVGGHWGASCARITRFSGGGGVSDGTPFIDVAWRV